MNPSPSPAPPSGSARRVGRSEAAGGPDERADLTWTPLPPTEVVAVTGASLGEAVSRPASAGSGPDSLDRCHGPADLLPKPGTEFLGFQLLEELGRGAFGRVYLARQGDLAGRPVAVKVTLNVGGEHRTLAQLQHTNIVPIYSFHQAGPFQAVCMPFFGRTTLADVYRHLKDRPDLPSSGRELRSTLARRGSATIPEQPSTHPNTAPSAWPGGPAAGAAVRTPDPGHAPDGWSRLDGLSYVEAVLWVGAQLADGLAHAHDRGVLHRDVKPANVLLTDEGRPMLLDFNLAEDAATRGSADRSAVGGTLPYMAPEHLRAFLDQAGTLDGRCDVYALGVILFELLTGRPPHPARPDHSSRDTVAAMIAAREQPPPGLRGFNPAVSPAAEAIVRKCLAPAPADRYQRAGHLREDIDRHLSHQPLKHAPEPSARERARKWARRHPRLASSGTLGVVAAAVLLAVGTWAVYSRERARDLHARARFADHQAAFRDAQVFLDDRNQSRPRLDAAHDRLRGILAPYGVPEGGDGDDWLAADPARRLPEGDRDRLRADVGETFFLMARVAHLRAFGADDPADRAAHLDRAARWNVAAERYAGDRLSRAAREQRADVAELAGRPDWKRLREEAGRIPLASPRDLYLVGAGLAQRGRYRDAVPYLERSTLADPTNFSAWFVLGTAHLELGQPELAAMSFGACLALRPDFAPAWLNRGKAFTELRFFERACDDFGRAVSVDPDLAEGYVQRAGVRAALGRLPEAEDDFGRALAAGAAPVRVHLLRADVRARRGDTAGAAADREAGLRLTPSDELGWVGRAEVRADENPAGALADVDEALKLNPFSAVGLQLKAHLLGERLDRPDDALAVLDVAVEFHPDHVPTRAGRGVALARRGKRDAALRDAKEALIRDTRAPNLYQVGCIYALTSRTHPGDKAEALRLLRAALATGFGLDIVDTDADLDPVRDDAEFQRIVAAARTSHPTPK